MDSLATVLHRCQGFAASIRLLFWVSLGIIGFGTLIVFFIPEQPLQKGIPETKVTNENVAQNAGAIGEPAMAAGASQK